jgi:hypothetical protein
MRFVTTLSLNHTKRAVASVLATVMVTLSVCVPLLEREEQSHGPMVESEHSASTCVQGHDHTICTQHGASRQLPSHAPRHGGVSHEAVALTPPVHEIGGTPDLQVSHDSRAPPLG